MTGRTQGAKTMKRIAATAAALGALALPAAAQAHISLHPNTIPAGAFVTLDVRVPGEESGAYADKVVMQIPPGFTEIDTENVPGWSVHETITNLKQPLQTADGPVSQEVSEITWTGDRTTLGRIDNGFFIQFPLSIAMPTGIAGRSLAFKTVEYYSNGVTAYWIGPPSANFPAPTINITKVGGVIEDVAGNEAGPRPGETGSGIAGTVTITAKSSSNTLAVVALVLAALALLAGLAGLRRRRS
jgi:periplasmic copper chaperone A